MDYSWIYTTTSAAAMAVLSAIGIYLALIIFTRTAGVRTFSKLSGFDFAITVAIGSLVASTVLFEKPPLSLSIIALLTLFLIQMTVATLRRKSSFVRSLVDNPPVLLMKGDKIIYDNMKKAKITRADLLAKLRESNVLKLDQIQAVVMESTGDISVLHHDKENVDFDTELLDDLEEEYKSMPE